MIRWVFKLLRFAVWIALGFVCWSDQANAQTTVLTWGFNTYGQLDAGTNSFKAVAVSAAGLSDISQVAGGSLHSIIIKSDGTVWTFGLNTSGQLGNATTANSSVPVQVTGLTGIVAVAGGTYHSLAVKSDGTVWSWGLNNAGQLGNGAGGNPSDSNEGTSTVPVQVYGLSGVVGVSAGELHSIAVKSDGTVWAWGDNAVGQLGLGTFGSRSNVPVQVTNLSGVVRIAAGLFHNLAVKGNGTVSTWGSNVNGELGLGTTTNSSSPSQVPGLAGVLGAAGGSYHSLVVKSDGTVWAWGSNFNGQLGNGTTTDSTSPVKAVNVTAAVGIAGGEGHSLALKSDGTVWSWGNNVNGELGNGTTNNNISPAPVLGLSGISGIGVGGFHNLSIRSENATTPRVFTTDPSEIFVPSGSMTILVNGDRFVAGSKVVFDGVERATDYVDSSKLMFTIPMSELQTGGVIKQVTVRNPAPDPQTSNAVWIHLASPVLSSVSLSTPVVVGGNSLSGTVTLSRSVSVDTVVTLSSLNTKAHIPVNVTVPVGSSSTDFTILTDQVTAASIGNIMATLSNDTKSAPLTVNPAVLSSLGLSATSISAGLSLTGTVTMASTVGVDTTITLTSTNPKAHVPATVLVLAGSLSATFAVTTDPVTTQSTGAITARYNGFTKSVNLIVKPPILAGLALNLNSVFGGTTVTGTITMSSAVAADTTVTLASANAKAHPPANVVVLAGNSSATFDISTDPVTANITGAITASFGGVPKPLNLTVKAPTYVSFALTPNPVVGGNSVTGTVTMSGPVAVDTVVNLTNGNSRATLPGSTVKILAGNSSVSYTITTMSTVTTVNGTVSAKVGTVNKAVTLKITP